MEQLQKLYNLYLDAGLISNQVTFDMFSNSTREQQAGLYDAGTRAGFINQTPFEQFETAFVKKKPEGEPTDSPLATGGSDSSEDTPLNTGREIDTLTIQIANLEQEIEQQLQEERQIPMTTEDMINTPAVETDEMIQLESLKKQRDELIKNKPDDVFIVSEDLEREKEMDIVDVALEFPNLDYTKLDASGRVKIESIASKYNQSPENFLFDVKNKKDEITSMTYMQNLGNLIAKSDKSLGEMLVSVPGTIYSMANVVGSRINKELGMLGIDVEDNITEEQFEELIGTGPLLKKLVEEQEYRKKKGDIWNQAQGIEGGPVENFKKGNYSDGFKQLGNMLAESSAVSIGIMMGSFSGLGIGQLARGGTIALAGPELRMQREENPEQSEAMNVLKALGLGGADMVFSSISSGSLGKVYRDIIFREGRKKGTEVFKKGLIDMYQQALKKYGLVAAGVGEGVEEVATQITQNLINQRPALEGVPDAFTVGVAGGGLYGSPITINNTVIKPLNEAVSRTKVNNILESSEFNNITQAFENPTIGDLQFDLSKVKRSDVILDKELKKRVDAGEMTQEEADKIKQNFYDTTVINVKLDATKLTGEQKVQAANLLRERDGLQKEVNEIDDASLSTVQQDRITEIDSELASLSKISVTESVALDTPKINIAPFFDTTIESVDDAITLRQSEGYQQQIQTINNILQDYNLTGEIEESIGGYKNEAGNKIVEISNIIRLGEGTTREQADQIASLLGALAPESQESSIAADYVDETDTTQNGFEYVLNVSDVQGTLEALKEAGITDFTLNDQNNSLTLLDLDFMNTEEFLDNLGALEEILETKQIEYDIQEQRAINSRFITKTERGEILSSLKESSIQQQLEGTSLYQKVEQALARDAETTVEETIKDDATTDEVVEETIEAPQDESQLLIDTINDPSASIEETVEAGREGGFTDAQIQKVLQGRGFKVKDIKPVLEKVRKISEETVGISLPAAFANIPGGINVGQPLFENIQKQLKKFQAKEEKTRAEIREKALEILRASEVYQNLDTIEQQELDVALDRAIGTTANRKIQQEIKGIKQEIKRFKEGVKDLKKAQARVSRFIRNVLPANVDIKKFVSSINKITSKQDLPAIAEKIVKDVQAIRDRQKQKLIKDIQTLARKKARIIKTRSNKSRGGDMSAQGKQFFQEVNKVLNTVFKGSPAEFDSMINELVFTSRKNKDGEVVTENSVARINELTLKEIAGEKLTQEESAFLDRMTAIELFGDIQSKSLEEVQDLLNDLKLARSQAIADLNRRKELKALRAKKIADRASKEIASEFPFLFNEEGNLESESRLNQKRVQTSIWKILDGKGVWKNLKGVIDKMRVYTIPGLTNLLREYMYHIGTISYELDGNKEGGVFSEYFYNRINSADNKAIEGRFKQDDKLNEIATSIDGVKSLQDLKKSFGYDPIKITTSEGTWMLSKDNLARIYALSLNDQQAAMLEKDGFDAAKIEEIKQILGKDIVEFVDKTVAYLSTENYESVNEVYREINDINLPRIENYFPTRTVREQPIDDFVANMSRGEFSNVFDAETSPLLARTNVKGKVSLNPDETFLNTLANHLETTERYKAFAAEVESLNTLVRTPAVQRLLKDALRQDKLVKQLINQAINPYAGKQLDQTTTWFMSNYTGVALSLKLIQYVKQATSFVNAFENYRYLPRTGKRGRLETIVDHIGFAADMAYTFLTFPVQLYEAYQLSPSFRDRINKGVKGDIVGLEAGGKEGRALRKKQQVLVRIVKQMFASPTVFGDAMGILGYKASLNRDLKNGMPRQEAIDKFNDYNATQQTRRGGERNTLQNSPEPLLRVFTMFMSTTFLQLNKAMQGMGGIMSSLSPYDGNKFSMKNIKRPTAKNMRAVSTNVFLANALFVMAANMFKYLKGSEEDKDEVIKRIMKSPLNILYSIPLVGGAAEEAYYYLSEESRSFRSRDIVNPYTETFRRGVKMYNEQEEKVDKKNGITPFLVSLLELYAGVQKNPIEGTVKTLTSIAKGDEVNPDDFYDMIGVSPYYRPTEEESTMEFSGGSGGKTFESEAMKKVRKKFQDQKKKFRDKFKSRFK